MSLTIQEASKTANIPLKYLKNYIKVGEELIQTRVGRSNKILRTEFERWYNQRNFGLVTLLRDDYLQCLEFAINSFYAYRSTSDFGTSTQRDAGKFISKLVIGKLGEIAVKKFLSLRFDIEIKLDFDIREAIVGQDITEMARPRRGGRVFNTLSKRVAIKTTKMKNVWLIVPEKEVTDPERTSDIYIFARVDLYLDHLIRLLRDHESLQNIKDTIPPFESIPAEVVGFIHKEYLICNDPTEILPVQKLEIGKSYIRRSGNLNRDKESWTYMLEEL